MLQHHLVLYRYIGTRGSWSQKNPTKRERKNHPLAMLPRYFNLHQRKRQPEGGKDLEDQLQLQFPVQVHNIDSADDDNTKQTTATTQRQLDNPQKTRVKMILLAWELTTLVLYKTTLCYEKFKFRRLADYFWLPSLFGWDLIFFTVLYHVIQRWSTKLLAVIVLLTASIVTLEVTFLKLNHISVPWDMTVTVLKDWKAYQGLVASETANAEGGLYPLYQTLLFQIVGTAVLVFLMKHTPIDALYMGFIKRHERKIRYFFLCYTVLVCTVRPSIPYKELSATPTVSAPFRIFQAVLQARRNRINANANRKKYIPTAKRHDMKDPEVRLNVVLILMETVRNDVMPFDGTTPWAQKHIVQDPKIWEQVTPFFANLTKQPNTLHIPMVKSASGFTHKSMVSIYCSQYAIPRKLTVEHRYTFYHECLPQILDSFGYKSQFFKSLTGDFDHQRDIMQKIGYPNIYDHETYTDMHHPTEQFVKNHRANYFGMEDSVHLPAVLDWVDDRKNQTDPFFLSYMTGITHHPYDTPPRWEGRKPLFSKDETINGYLNEISYTDEFLQNFTQAFDERNLTESTLFVVMGDHGLTTKQRSDDSMTTYGINFEEAFNVGVTFHTKNKKVAERLRAGKTHVEKGKWVSIDVFPTILNILNLPNFQPPTASNSKNNTSSSPLTEFADGRSMLQPSGKRLQVSICNPGNGIVLRDGDRLVVVPFNEIPEIFDMELDPGQLKPIPIDQSGVTDKLIKDHIEWGEKAVAFVNVLKNDISQAYRTGNRCIHKNCALELLMTLESLDQWDVGSHFHK